MNVLQALLNSRTLFQHGYGTRTDNRAHEVWSTMTDAGSLLAKHVEAVVAWHDAATNRS